MSARRERTTLECPHAVTFAKHHHRTGVVSVADYEALHHAWTSGAAFFDGTDPWGNPITVRLADVSTIVLWTEHGLQRSARDDEIERERNLTTGE